MGIPQHTKLPIAKREKTSIYMSALAKDMRDWLALIRFGCSYADVVEHAIRDLAHASGYTSGWRELPENQAILAKTGEIRPDGRWYHTGAKHKKQDETQMDVEQERTLEEVYA